MSTKSFLIVLLLAVLTSAGAAWTVLQQPTVQSADGTGEAFFPNLPAQINDVQTITLRGEGEALEMTRQGQNWVLSDRGDYAAKGDRIVELLVNLTQLAKLEPKTSDPEKYERLELDAPDVEGSEARELIVKTGSGDEVVNLIVGRRKFMIGDTEGGIYVRQPGEPQSWLAKGSLNPMARPRDWLVRDIVDIDRARISEITITHEDGEVLRALKSSEEAENFLIPNLPATAQLRRDTVANELSSVPDGLMLDDVKPAADVSLENPTRTVASYSTFDGLTLEIDLQEVEGDRWLTVSASVAEGSDDAIWQEAAAITARTSGWAYYVPAFEVNQMKKRMADMIEEPAS